MIARIMCPASICLLPLTWIPQLNRICRERGGLLEQRKRPTVKLQSHFALSHVVAMSLAFSPSTGDQFLLRGTNPSTSLCERVAPRAFCRSQLRNRGRSEERRVGKECRSWREAAKSREI